MDARSNRLIRNYAPRGPLRAYGSVTLRYGSGRDDFLRYYYPIQYNIYILYCFYEYKQRKNPEKKKTASEPCRVHTNAADCIQYVLYVYVDE